MAFIGLFSASLTGCKGCGHSAPAVPAPVIKSFTASAPLIMAGESITFTWEVTGATKLEISGGEVGESPVPQIVTGTSVTLKPDSTAYYSLEATNSSNKSAFFSGVRIIVVNCEEDISCRDILSAVRDGDMAKIQALLKDKPELVSRGDKSGCTPLHVAAITGHKEVAKLLLAKGAKVNTKCDRGNTPLHWAAQEGYAEIVALLLAQGADVNSTNDRDWTPLHSAADGGHRDVSDLLLAHGADVNARAHVSPEPRLVAVPMSEEAKSILQAEARAETEAQEERLGERPLHLAAEKGYNDVVELLLAHKAEVDAKTESGETPLYLAAREGHKDVVELLLAHGADVNAKDKNFGRTPLHVAAVFDHKDVVELLLAHGANVNAKTNDGETPLHFAGGMGYEDVEELLRQHGGHE
jgi:ankyrin repeat protein